MANGIGSFFLSTLGSLHVDRTYQPPNSRGLYMVFIPAIIAVSRPFVLAKSVKIIGQAEVMVVERLGRFHRVARSG